MQLTIVYSICVKYYENGTTVFENKHDATMYLCEQLNTTQI
jgi:hypothetical protein